MSNVRVDMVASSQPPRTAWERLQFMDILNRSSRDFILQPESDRSCPRPAEIGRQQSISRPDTERSRERRPIGNTFGRSRPTGDIRQRRKFAPIAVTRRRARNRARRRSMVGLLFVDIDQFQHADPDTAQTTLQEDSNA